MVVAQTPQAKVQSVNGKEIYLLSEPVADYETVASVKTAPKLTSLLTRGIYNEHVNDKATQFMNRAMGKLDRKSIVFDALVYEGGKSIRAIKFNEASEGIANVRSIEDIKVFAMATPLQSFQIKEQIGNGVNIVPFLTYGWINNSIEKDVEKYIRKASKQENVDAVLYQSGRKATLITLN